jgi:hypothetical protein
MHAIIRQTKIQVMIIPINFPTATGTSSFFIFSKTLSYVPSSVYGYLVRREELALDGRAIFFGEQGQKSVANFELFDDSAETLRPSLACFFDSTENLDDTTYP